jgi:hypothetical protein
MPGHPVTGPRSRSFSAGVFTFLALFLLVVLALLAADVAYVNLDSVREVFRWPELRSAVWLSLDAVEAIPTAYEHEKSVRVSVIRLSCNEKGRLVEKFLDFRRSDGKMIFAEFGYVK